MLHEIIPKMTHHTYIAGTDIFVENDGTKNLFILISGSVEVVVQGYVKSTLTAGATFGDIALLNDSPRTATVRTTSVTECWTLDRTVYRDVVKRFNKSLFSEISK